MTLSACSTKPEEIPLAPKVIEIEKPYPVAPEILLEPCPTELAKLDVEQDVWENLNGEQQLNLIVTRMVEWGIEYSVCSMRHNALVSWVQSND